MEALFPTARGEVLAATLTQPDKWWYLTELAQFIRTSPSSLQRELEAIVDGGILEQRREGTRIYTRSHVATETEAKDILEYRRRDRDHEDHVFPDHGESLLLTLECSANSACSAFNAR